MLVLGPDSSISPLIFAAITPHLVAGDSPETAIALAGMLALLVGGVLLVLLVLPRITIRVPAILVAVVGATALSAESPAATGPSHHRGDRI